MTWSREAVLAFMAIAFAAGFFLGLLVAGRRR